MNLIEESFQSKEEKKKKTTTKIILAAIIFVVMVIIGIVSYMVYLQATKMTLTINGQQNEKFKELLVFDDDGTIYIPIKEAANYLGYKSYNGEYSERSEEPSKCYIECESEVANFELGQNKIYKLDITQKDANYQYEYMEKPIKAIDGVLYVSTEGLQKGFNTLFDYNVEKNTITIWTLPELYQRYATSILDAGYVELSPEFVNQKSILRNQLIALKDKDKNQFGVIGTDGKIILEPKYDKITYLPNTGDFLVENDKKVGIISPTGETKVQIIYDSIELMDSDSGLYLAKKDEKCGVIDSKGKTKIYIENDEIGISNISNFSQNNIKNKYILADNLIPARKDKYWGLYNKNGELVVEYEYESFGYIAASNKDALNLLIIPKYNVLVACKDKKYGLINAQGKVLLNAIADDIYMTISGGEKHYYITAGTQKVDAESWLDKNGIVAKDSKENNEEQETKKSSKSSEDEEEQEEETQKKTTKKKKTTKNNDNDENNNEDDNNEEQDNENNDNNEEENNDGEEE